MQIYQSFRIQPKEVVAFVGGGGKTTAMFRLADELAARGQRVITTTTTRIFAAQIKLAPYCLTCPHLASPVHRGGNGRGEWGEVVAALADHPHTLIIGETNEEGKAFGIAPEVVDEIAQLDEVDALLYEADGSRMRPFKAPADHEPVIAHSTTLLVPVVGIHALGQPLDGAHVHRAEIVARLAGAHLGDPITPLTITRVVASERGGLKGLPSHARVIALINQVESETDLAAARHIARLLMGYDIVEAVAIGAVRAATPIHETHRRVAALVTAAGASTRMQGRVKQLLPWRGVTLIENALECVAQSQVDEKVLVLGAHWEEIRAAIENTPAVRRGKSWRALLNQQWEEGHASSIRVGLSALLPHTDAAIFINADQPFLTPQVIDALIQRYRETDAPIVRAVYAGKPGSPALFNRAFFSELAALEGDEGGRAIIAQHLEQVERVDFDDARLGFDVDTIEDYQRATAIGDRMTK